MAESKQFQEWQAVRSRLRAEERAFSEAHAAHARGEPTDMEALDVKRSEIRALRALSMSLVKRSGAQIKPWRRKGPSAR